MDLFNNLLAIAGPLGRGDDRRHVA